MDVHSVSLAHLPHSEHEYRWIVKLLDELIDHVGEDESHHWLF